jgi:hypothetical protein
MSLLIIRVLNLVTYLLLQSSPRATVFVCASVRAPLRRSFAIFHSGLLFDYNEKVILFHHTRDTHTFTIHKDWFGFDRHHHQLLHSQQKGTDAL